MKQEGKDLNLTAFQYGLAGAISGTVTRFLVQPLDVLKITFQLQVTPLHSDRSPKYFSILQAVRLIVKEEGVKGLWKGHIPAQFLSAIFGAVQFSIYEELTNYFYKTSAINFSKTEHFINIGCGAFAGLSATIISFPFDIIKTHLVYQSEPRIYTGSLDVVKKIYQKEGARGFSKGLLAACIQTTPMSGLVFCFHGLFAQIWFLLFQKIESDNYLLSTAGNVTTGLCAGLCAKTIVYPYDLMKKRLQIQAFHLEKYRTYDIMKCNSIRECFLLTVRTEGPLGLFKGFLPTILKSGATTSLYFTVYSKACLFIKYMSENS